SGAGLAGDSEPVAEAEQLRPVRRRVPACDEMCQGRDMPETDEIAFAAVSTAFGSLGRFCMALDGELRVRHVSARIDDLLGPGTAAAMRGRPIVDLLGPELFGPDG